MSEGERIAGLIRENAGTLAQSVAVVGLDGFVDTLCRVIKQRNPGGDHLFFREIEEFGRELMTGRGTSRSFELKVVATKIGGNAPIIANAFGSLGLPTHCLGNLGAPAAYPVFPAMSSNCRLHSFGNPGTTTALEFSNGKIMLAEMESLHEVTWSAVVQSMGRPALLRVYDQARIIGLVNWAEADSSGSLWRGLLREVLPDLRPRPDRLILFDLADCSKRSKGEIAAALETIKEFRAYGRVILSMNESEARMVASAVAPGRDVPPMPDLGQGLHRRLEIDCVAIHSDRRAWAWSQEGTAEAGTRFVANPTITTGGGDNFNAGLTTGLLLGVDLRSALHLGNAMSSFYVSRGRSTDLAELMTFLSSEGSEEDRR